MNHSFSRSGFAVLILLASAAVIPGAFGEETLIRAFPGAEGFGACTPGGRGGQAIYVTTLEDYLPGQEERIEGSLRAAIDTKGPRTVLFRVSGTISLKADLWVRHPFLTLAGQSAPGDGVCLKDYQFVLATHDVIVRHLRFRSGDLTRKEQMAVGVFGAHDCILDHCSMSWAIDEVLSSFGAYNLTVQWCIVAEGLSRSYHPKGEHSKGSIIDGKGGITIHHTLYAHNAARNPRVNTVILDFRNNVLYNWGYRAAYTQRAPSYVNWVGNSLKPGPTTRKSAVKKIFDPGDDLARVFLADNVLEGHPIETADNTLLIHARTEGDQAAFRATIAIPEPFRSPPVATDSAEVALQRVLAEAGAILPRRDSADLRLMEEVRTGGGRIIDSQEEGGGWPRLEGGAAPLDSDLDGMPDEWEAVHGFDSSDPTDGARDADADGYTNLEEFLNETNPHIPDADSRVNAAEHHETLRLAQEMSVRGRQEFDRQQAELEAVRKEANLLRSETLRIVFDPADLSAEKVEIDLNGEAVLEMVRIPAGSFLMGTPESEGGLPRERPRHLVHISRPFYFATTKTTTAQFNAILGPDAKPLREGNPDLPAHEVTWDEANEFCRAMSRATGRTFRLPTEAEWEYACRAGTTTPFHTGEVITSDQANFDAAAATPFNPIGISRGKITPVGMFPPNPWGLYDMHGNQSEYCQDICYREYTEEEVTDPKGPDLERGARVLRGGKATSKAFYIRSGYRYGYAPGVGYGFRAVMEAVDAPSVPVEGSE